MASTLWSDLPEELLQQIFDALTDFFDLLRCRCVCVSWRTQANKLCHNMMTTPLLLLSPRANASDYFFVLMSASNSVGYRACWPDSLARMRCLSCHRGWLLMADVKHPTTSQSFLYNPLSAVHVRLPTLPHQPHYSLPLAPDQFLTSCSPHDRKNCVVLVCLDNVGYACKIGDKEWKRVDGQSSWAYSDMIYYKGEPYGVDPVGTLRRLKLAEEGVGVVVAVDRVYPHPFERYLAESSTGELLMAVRRFGYDNDKPFVVFRLDWMEGVWKEVRGFGGDQALLLAHNDSTFVPAGSIYKGNCIYFVDDLWGGNSTGSSDYGVYELGSRKIRRFNQSCSVVVDASLYRWFRLLD